MKKLFTFPLVALILIWAVFIYAPLHFLIRHIHSWCLMLSDEWIKGRRGELLLVLAVISIAASFLWDWITGIILWISYEFGIPDILVCSIIFYAVFSSIVIPYHSIEENQQ